MTTKPFGQKGLQNMRVLLDTNVILDVLCAREPFLADASKVWKLCEVEKLDGHLSALSIPNIVYILRKELDPVKTKQVIDQLSLLFSIEDLKTEKPPRKTGTRGRAQNRSPVHAHFVRGYPIIDFEKSQACANSGGWGASRSGGPPWPRCCPGTWCSRRRGNPRPAPGA